MSGPHRNAKIEGMASDLNLIGYRYNIILSIFFIVYLSVEVPSNVVLKHVGPRYYSKRDAHSL
jgi:hypothetical protein